MPTPSLLIVPARFKTGKLYSQIPTSGAGDFTVTRNTTATRLNSAGLLESVASGIPRLDYYTSGGVTGCPALLVEPAATNLHTQSEAFASNYTTVLNLTASGTNLTAPDNSATADRFFETTANDSHLMAIAPGGGFALTSGTVYTFSTFVQSVGGRNFRLILTAGGSLDILYTLSGSGTVSNTSVATIQNFGNGWYRCTYTFTATSSNNFRQNVYSVSGTTNSFAGDVTKGFIVWGAQLETGSVATSYIPTTAGTGSRSADVISVSGAVSGSIGQTEGTFYVEFQASPSGASTNWLNISDGTTNNWLFIGKSENKCRGYLKANNNVILTDTSFTLTGSFLKAALAYKSGDYAFYINGNIIASGTTAFTFSAALRSIHTGLSTPSASDEISRYRAVTLYTTRLTNPELAALTAP